MHPSTILIEGLHTKLCKVWVEGHTGGITKAGSDNDGHVQTAPYTLRENTDFEGVQVGLSVFDMMWLYNWQSGDFSFVCFTTSDRH